jgi:DNA-binding CsgD family transcriptional regulator
LVVSEIIGRESELADVVAFIDEQRDGPAALILDGEAGIGKSTIWLAGVDHARSRGHTVLLSRPAEAERSLAHAGLGDLFEAVLDDALPALSAPRRRALEVALLRQEAAGHPVDRRAVAVAVRDALAYLSDDAAVLVAIDDIQWLDPSSASALAFALRRLDTNHVVVLLARRVAGGTATSELDAAISPERRARLSIGPLSVGALHRLLRDRLDQPFARQTLLRIHEQSGGNPFFALELARSSTGDEDELEPLRVPKTLEALLRRRLSGLPRATREALAFAAALGTAPESALLKAGILGSDLEPAIAANVLVRESGSVRFSHPLLASVLYHDLGDKRRAVHRRIAELVDDPIGRARHLARSAESPDASVAGFLTDAATVAADRGASAAAAELYDHAARLTPAAMGPERRRRILSAARAHQVAGEWPRAQAMAAELLAEPGEWRAEAMLLLAELEARPDHRVDLLEQALRETSGDLALQSVIHTRLAWAQRFDIAADHAGTAIALAASLGDEVLRTRARAVQAVLAWFAGRSPAPEDLPMLAHEFAQAVGGEQLVQEATLAIANTLAPISTRDQARNLLEREYESWRERDERRSARALWGLAWVEFWAGRWELAAGDASQARDISIQYGLETPQDHLPTAVIAVHRGKFEQARTHSGRALDLSHEQLGFHPPQHLAVLGLAALWTGDAATALDLLNRADQRAAFLGWGEPSVRWWVADEVELLLELGKPNEAMALLDRWAEDATRVARAWVLAHATRCRGLIAAARGDIDRAIALLEQAVAEHEAVGDPYGRARAQLALGSIRRRARQKRRAREAIEEAVAGFQAIGAEGWASRARSELGRIGGRTRETGLTAAERRVAVLVAQGRTNREVATALFLGERTVASHLTHAYAKLGVRSRLELARKVQTF